MVSVKYHITKIAIFLLRQLFKSGVLKEIWLAIPDYTQNQKQRGRIEVVHSCKDWWCHGVDLVVFECVVFKSHFGNLTLSAVIPNSLYLCNHITAVEQKICWEPTTLGNSRMATLTIDIMLIVLHRNKL